MIPIISLRTSKLSDSEELFAIFNEPEIIKFTNFKFKEDINSVRDFLERFLKINFNAPLQYGPYCIYLDEKIIGMCGLQQVDLDKGISELWYILHKNYWGKGYAKEAVEILTHISKSNKLLRTVYAEAVTMNTPSWKILEHMGFQKSGEEENGFTKNGAAYALRKYVFEMQKNNQRL